MFRFTCLVSAFLFLSTCQCLAFQEISVQLPAGMSIQMVSTDEMATNIFCMTINSKGQTVVSGPGYVKTLIDSNQDGVFDQTIEFASGPASGAQGMFFDGADLICTGDGGLLRFKDTNDDGVADGPPETLLPLKTGGEHMAHAVRRGPDGWFYVLCGNMVSRRPEYYNGPNSPVKNPEAGFLMRISPDWETREIVAHGYRNAYDFDFNRAGEIFVYDSDGERDISLPWYRPTRVFQIRPGDHAGWISAGWKRPSYYFDMPLEIGALGRGSPTGVCCYQHHQFGSEYDNAIFVADWTFGRIIVFKKDEDGYDRGSEFAISRGQFGFAVTDLVVAPDGSLLVSIGGRGTEGGVFRIKNIRSNDNDQTPNTELPFSSWGRVAWSKDQLDWDHWLTSQNNPTSSQDRVLLVQRITNAVGGAPVSVLRWALEQLKDDHVCAAIIRSAARNPWDELTIREINRALVATGKQTRIAALATLVGRRDFVDDLNQELKHDLFDGIRENLAHPDEPSFRLIFNMIQSWPDELAFEFETTNLSEAARCLVLVAKARDIEDRVAAFETCMALLQASSIERGLMLRLAQLTMDGCGPGKNVATVFDGYTPRIELPLSEDQVLALQPSTDRHEGQIFGETDLEFRRISAMLGRDGRDLIQPLENTQPCNATQDVIWLIQIARTHRDVSPVVLAETLLDLGRKLRRDELGIDRNWYPRIREIARRLIKNQPDITNAILQNQTYGSDWHTYLHDVMPKQLKPSSAIAFSKAVEKNPLEATAAQLRIAATASELNLSLLRKCTSLPHLKDEAIIALAKQPLPEDRLLFSDGLESFNPTTVKRSAIALRRLADQPVPEELRKALRAAKRLGWDKQGVSIRDQIVLLLQEQTGKSFGYQLKANGKVQNDALTRWQEFLVREYPDQFPAEETSFDFEEMLSQVDWSTGDVDRGWELYLNHQCALCHDGGSRLGPKLAGIGNRFSKRDLFRSIAFPSEQLPDRYRALIVETEDGLIITGTVIYESIDGITLLDSAGKTVRINKSDIEAKTLSQKSLMPDGLLNQVDEQGWADLYAFIKTL